ncbi:MAG: N-acetylmuramoyl-L-alanine amidase, partial [Prevotellaceae bacterium]|nr:N-acetylmuramoyl-L-alanine amidase [Prevotellaceae bacterium]
MGQIDVIKKDGTLLSLQSVEPFRAVTSAVQKRMLMGEDTIQLTVKSDEIINFAIGDKIVVCGEEYAIRTHATREIVSDNLYSYELTFYGVMYELIKSQYRNTDANGNSSKSTFDLTYGLSDFVKVIIYNLNRDYSGIWQFDEDNCPVTEPKTMGFSKQNCLQVLQSVCKEFEYEFRIVQDNGQRIIQVGNFGQVVNPPAGNTFFEYGKGNGLYKLKEQKIDDRSVITRLWIEGGNKNLKADYREYSDRLQLPYPQRLNTLEHILSDGTVIVAGSQTIGIADDAKRYFEDADLRNRIGSIEDTEYFEDIYPHRTGIVTALGGDIYSFVDSEMDFDLNENDGNNTKWLIAGVSAKINFITGKLAGQQFELSAYIHSTKTFTIIKYADERGLSFPTDESEAFRVGVGDKYVITDINLPAQYVANAEENLWYAGLDKFMDRKQPWAQYILTFDRLYFIESMPDDSETLIFNVGDYVPIKDARFDIEKTIRIQQTSRNLMLEHDYTLTLSDTTAISILTQTVLDVIEHDNIIEINRLRDLNKARRSWRTTEELRTMVYDTDGYFDAGNIRPNSIDTNMLTVGSKSQQFILENIILQANVNGLPNQFAATAGKLIHLTINSNEARTWNISAISATLENASGYYVFAKCSKSGSTGIFYITQTQMKFEDESDTDNYYFLVGIIGSVNQNFRDFTTTYGFTRINGNTITTGKIQSSGGTGSFFDLDNNQFRIGDGTKGLGWNENNNG